MIAVADEAVVAPMYGKIIDVKVKVGDSVKEGDTICVMESMKMEVPIAATKSGVIKKINILKDQTVQPNSILAVIGY